MFGGVFFHLIPFLHIFDRFFSIFRQIFFLKLDQFSMEILYFAIFPQGIKYFKAVHQRPVACK